MFAYLSRQVISHLRILLLSIKTVALCLSHPKLEFHECSPTNVISCHGCIMPALTCFFPSGLLSLSLGTFVKFTCKQALAETVSV